MRIAKRAAILAAVPVLAATLTAAAATPAGGHPGGGCPSRWSLLPASSVRDQAAVSSVTALSRHDVWFTGNHGPLGIGARVLRGNGRAVSAPPAQIPSIPLELDAWGTGQDGSPGSFDSAADGWELTIPSAETWTGLASFATAEHWHDGRWTLMPMVVSPDPATTGVELNDIAALSPTSAWAAGGFYRAGPPFVAGTVPVGALIEHWDGTAWTVVPNPAAKRPGGTLLALTAVSPSDIWAVGRQDGAATGSVVPLVEHWDGAAWSIIPAPGGDQPSALYAISGTGPGGLWAAGDQTEPGTSDTAVPLVEHWDGRAWTVQRLPWAGNGALAAVYAASPSDVWAGGVFGTGLANVFLHWDGRRWMAVPLPGPREFGLTYQVSAMGGTGPDDIWAAGLAAGAFNSFTLIAHLGCG